MSSRQSIILFAAALCLGLSACGGSQSLSQRGKPQQAAGRTVGATIDDNSIVLGLNRDLQKALPGFARSIGTEVREGRVLLVGTVKSPEERLSAGQIAWNVRGVREVVNELQIGEPQSLLSFTNDARISNQMRLRLATAGGVNPRNFNIETVNSTMYILGVAKNKAELEHVAYLAATIKGVNKVVSHALLSDDPRRFAPPQPASAVQIRAN